MEQEFRLKFLYRTAVISGAFCLIVGLLLLLNYLQFSSREPLESKAMEALIERLAEDPRNIELKQDIRNLDLLARKAYFSGQWQIRTGSYLLLFGAIVFAFSLRYYHSLRARIPEPEEDGREVFRGGTLTQRWILGSGAVLIIAAVASAILTTNKLEMYNPVTASADEEGMDNIEVIDLVPDETGVPEPDETDENAGTVEADPSESANIAPKTEVSGTQAEGYTPSSNARFISSEEIMAYHNSFRGPWGNGISYHKNIPVQWDGSSEKAVIWKKEVPLPGYNSPVIWKDLLFISGADQARQVIFCYDCNTGELKWEAETGEIPGTPASKPRVTEDTGLAAPGMAVDGSRVFAIFATGDVVCYSIGGQKIWARNLGVPDNHYGHSSSLLVFNDKLFIQYDSNRGGRVLALNVLTGETVWDTRRATGISWASPVLVEHKGGYQLVLNAEPLLAAYDIETGKELWSVECMMGEVGPSPAYSSGKIYAANEYARLVAIDLDKPTEILWEDDEYLPEVASPVAIDGLLFIATSYGVLACYDALTGDKHWEKEYGQGFYSSPVIAEGKLYAMDMGGNMHVIGLKKEFSLIAEPKLGENAYTTPAFAEGRIYIRGEEHLYCIGN